MNKLKILVAGIFFLLGYQNAFAGADFNSNPNYIGSINIFSSGLSIAASSDGDLYAAKASNNAVYHYDSGGALKRTWTGSSNGGSKFVEPYDVDVDGDYVYVIEGDYPTRTQKFSLNGDYLQSFGLGGFRVSASSNRIYAGPSRSVQYYDNNNGNYGTLGNFYAVDGVAQDRDNSVYVLYSEGFIIKKYSSTYDLVWEWKMDKYCNSIDTDEYGNIYMTMGDGYVRQYDKNRNLKREWKLPNGKEPYSAALNDNGDLYVTNLYDEKVYHYKFNSIPTLDEKNDGVYRFWSENFSGHFYTASFSEAENVYYNDANWKYEGVAYDMVDSGQADAIPVYRFWSDKYRHHFYTASEAEKEHIINNDKNWSYEAIAYYAYSSPSADTIPVYRFWSDTKRGHFYTASPSEKDHVENSYDDKIWRYEGMAWYVNN